LAKVAKSFGFTVPPAMDLSKLFRRSAILEFACKSM
jgi:hypothetical protein